MPTPLLPETPVPVSYEISSKTNTLRSESLSGKILTRKIGGQRFALRLVYPPMQKATFGAITAFLNEQDGQNGIFYVRVPQLGSTQGAAGEYVNYTNHTKLYQVDSAGTGVTPAVLYAVSNTVLTGAIDTTASTAVVGVGTLFTTELIVGDSILVGGETRIVSAITDNLNLTVSVAFSDLVNDTTPERVVAPQETASVYMRCSLSSNIQKISYGDDGTVRLEIDLVERI